MRSGEAGGHRHCGGAGAGNQREQPGRPGRGFYGDERLAAGTRGAPRSPSSGARVEPCAMDRPGCPRPSRADSLHALFCLAVRRWQSTRSSRGVPCPAPIPAVPSPARDRQRRDRHRLGDLAGCPQADPPRPCAWAGGTTCPLHLAVCLGRGEAVAPGPAVADALSQRTTPFERRGDPRRAGVPRETPGASPALPDHRETCSLSPTPYPSGLSTTPARLIGVPVPLQSPRLLPIP